MGMKRHPVANPDAVTDNSARENSNILPDNDILSDKGLLHDSSGNPRAGCKERQQLGECKIGILNDDHVAAKTVGIEGKDNSRRPGCSDFGGIFGVCQKRNLPIHGIVQCSEPINPDRRVTNKTAIEDISKFLQRFVHD